MALSATDKLRLEQIENNFSYHAPNGDQAEKYVRIRRAAKDLARLTVELCPDSRERSVALTKLEESVMWANASIARQYDDPTQ